MRLRRWAPGSAWGQAGLWHRRASQLCLADFLLVSDLSCSHDAHPATPDPSGAGSPARTPNEPSGPLISSFHSGLSSSPFRLDVSLAQPRPHLSPPWLHSRVLLPAQGTEKLLALPKALRAVTPQTSLYFYCSVNYCLNFNKSLRQEGGPAVSFSVQTRPGSDSGVI